MGDQPTEPDTTDHAPYIKAVAATLNNTTGITVRKTLVHDDDPRNAYIRLTHGQQRAALLWDEERGWAITELHQDSDRIHDGFLAPLNLGLTPEPGLVVAVVRVWMRDTDGYTPIRSYEDSNPELERQLATYASTDDEA